jgi:hypothetical protein
MRYLRGQARIKGQLDPTPGHHTLSKPPFNLNLIIIISLHINSTYSTYFNFNILHIDPWLSKELKQILFLKKKAHLKFKASSNVCDYRTFFLLRAKFKYESKKCLPSYAKSAKQLLKKNPCNYWKFINSNCSDNDIPKQLSFNGSVSSDKQGAADLLASYFSSVYLNDQSVLNLDDLNIPTFDLPNNISISVDDAYLHFIAYRPLALMAPGEFLFQLKFIISYTLWLILKYI